MNSPNLRHVRVFLAVIDCGAPTAAAELCGISQPAVTQAIAKMEAEAGGALFDRTRAGFFPTERGRILEARLRRAMERLDAALAAVAPRLKLTATAAQLQALVAIAETQNTRLAARKLGLAQPTVHRAMTQLEAEARRALFERTSFGMVPTRPCRQVAQAARLAFAEFGQAAADLAEFDGRDGGAIVVGTLPLCRSVVLPEALLAFREARPGQRVTVLDGSYDELLGGLRRGDIDVMIGALRDPAPVADVVQEALFPDRLCVVARPGHPLASGGPVSVETLVGQAWAVPRPGTPSRTQFDALFARLGRPLPESILDCGSILLMRELLSRSDLLGCISQNQARAEIAHGLIARVPTEIDWPERPIGLTYRAAWVPTRAQSELLDMLRAAGERTGRDGDAG